jgi:hypothetical protein
VSEPTFCASQEWRRFCFCEADDRPSIRPDKRLGGATSPQSCSARFSIQTLVAQYLRSVCPDRLPVRPPRRCNTALKFLAAKAEFRASTCLDASNALYVHTRQKIFYRNCLTGKFYLTSPKRLYNVRSELDFGANTGSRGLFASMSLL